MNDWGRDWDDEPVYDDEPDYADDDLSEENSWTLRQVVIRVAALLLLFSFLGGLFLALRGIEDILIVIGVLLAVALVAKMLRKQQESERPYQSKDRPEIH